MNKDRDDLRTGKPETTEPELLDTGQEEVFSRAEVEAGRIEHNSAAGAHGAEKDAPDGSPSGSEAQR